MSALGKFFDRHGIDENIRAKALGAISLAAVAALVAMAPTKSLADDFSQVNSSPAPRMDTIEEFISMATRSTNRMADMQAINRALHDMAELTNATDGDLAARIIVAIDKKLYEDTPFQSFGQFDTTNVRYPTNVEDGAPIKVVISSINYQRQSLAWSANRLQDVVDAYRSGSREAISDAVNAFDESVSMYENEEPGIMKSLSLGFSGMIAQSESNITPANGYRK